MGSAGYPAPTSPSPHTPFPLRGSALGQVTEPQAHLRAFPGGVNETSWKQAVVPGVQP